MRGSAISNNGFTLAEVLITLGIIGVVAAMTLPGLITKYEKKVLANQTKVFYSEFNQALSMAISKNGDMASWVQTQYQNATMPDERIQAVFKELKGQVCYVGYGPSGWVGYDAVYKPPCTTIKNYIKDLDEVNSGFHSSVLNTLSNSARFALSGGMILADGAIIFGGGHTHYDDRSTYSFSDFYVDVNGFKKPNVLGKDIQQFIIVYRFDSLPSGKCFGQTASVCFDKNKKLKPGFYPSGFNYDLWISDKYFCTGDKNTYRNTCTARMVKDGWQFKDDYPW